MGARKERKTDARFLSDYRHYGADQVSVKATNMKELRAKVRKIEDSPTTRKEKKQQSILKKTRAEESEARAQKKAGKRRGAQRELAQKLTDLNKKIKSGKLEKN